jgi:hypothetical protein
LDDNDVVIVDAEPGKIQGEELSNVLFEQAHGHIRIPVARLEAFPQQPAIRRLMPHISAIGPSYPKLDLKCWSRWWRWRFSTSEDREHGFDAG